MNLSQNELTELESLCEEVKVFEEAGLTYLLLKDLRLPVGCIPEKSDGLLCPTPAHGYNARLFFPTTIESKQKLNWNYNGMILERNWRAYSWQVNRTDLRLIEKVAVILGGLR